MDNQKIVCKWNEQKEYLRYIITAIVLGVIVYMPMISNDLVNNLDGIWHPSNFIAGDWEISLGRGLQRYADRSRFGLVTSSWNSILVFFLIGLGDALFIKKFKIEQTIYSYLFILITIANPVTSESLTYSYMSVNFGFAYFFALIAFYYNPIEDKRYKKIINLCVASFAFAISMSFYQAYICVFSVCCLYFTLSLLKRKDTFKNILTYVLNSIIVFLFGGLTYFMLTKLFLMRAGIEMTNYRGANSISILMLFKSLPNTFLVSYKEYLSYFLNNRLNANLEFALIIVSVIALGVVALIIREVIILCKSKITYAVGFATIALLIPCTSCIICLVAIGNSISGLMAMGIVFSIIGVYVVVKETKIARVACFSLVAILAWYYLGTVANDQIALKEGITATKTITNEVISDINDSQLLDEVSSVAFVGRLADNPYFYKSGAYEMSNAYAQFGRWSTDARNNRATWNGIINTFMGLNLPLCDNDTYDRIRYSQELEDMPIFPKEGYIMKIGDVLVVKTSLVY